MTRTTHASDGDRHSSDVNALLYHKGKLYSGADDGKIKVWDESLKLIGKIDDAHYRSVFALVASNDTLYSSSNDGTIKSWNLNDLKLNGILTKGHREIWKLAYDNNVLYSADNKGTVELYVNDKLAVAKNFIEPIRDLMVMDNLLYTQQELDINIRLIKSKYGDFERRKTIMGGVPMCSVGGKLCYCSRSGKDISLRENSLDLNFKEVSETQELHTDRIHALLGVARGESLLYSGGGDKVVKQWKIDGKCLVKIAQCPLKTGINVMTAGQKGEVYVGCRDGFMFRLDF